MILLETSETTTFVLTFVFEGIYCSAWRKSSSEPADNWVTDGQRCTDVGIPRTAAPLYSKTWIQVQNRGKTQRQTAKESRSTLTIPCWLPFYLYKWVKGTYIKTLASKTSTCLNCNAICARHIGSDLQCQARIIVLQLYLWLRTQCNTLNNSFYAE